jgi:SPP1 gp7 family putative phage head morphogenesis protein
LAYRYAGGVKLPLLTLASDDTIKTPNKLIKQSLNSIFKGKHRPSDINKETWKHNYNAMLKALQAGWGENFVKVKFEHPDWEYIQNLKYNTAVFDAFKSNKEIKEAYKLLFDENGKLRSWKEFYNEAKKLSSAYNVRWLQAEFNQAHHSARMARRWKDFEADADLYPNLKYIAVQDERTRESHKRLHEKIYPIDHPFWDEYYPPNGWGCRCTARPTDQEPDETLPDEEDLPSQPSYMHNNVGKTARVFDESHPYYSSVSVEEREKILSFVHSNIKPSSQIKQSYEVFKGYSNTHKTLYFDGNTGGFIVRHPGHQINIGTKYEQASGKNLARRGKHVELLDETGPGTSLDMKFDNQEWEIKGVKNTPGAIRDQIKRAVGQGAQRVILFQYEGLDYSALKQGLARYIGYAKKYNKATPEVYYFNSNKELKRLK